MIQRAVVPALILALAALGAVVALLLAHVVVPETLYALVSLAGGGTLATIVPTALSASPGVPAAPVPVSDPVTTAKTAPAAPTLPAAGTTTTAPDGTTVTLPPA